MNNKEKLLWVFFLIFTLASLITYSTESSFSQTKPLAILILYLPIVLTLLHAILTLSTTRAALFFTLVIVLGFIFEYLGLRDGILFGGAYAYMLRGIYLLTVPVIVLAYWSVFMYLGYTITNSFLHWLQKEKPTVLRGSFFTVALLSFVDALFVVGIDLFMDPLRVRMGDWTWIEGGAYFGVPVGNFIGWILLTFVATGIYRLYEYYKPKRVRIEPQTGYLMPIAGYAILYVSFLNAAFVYSMKTLALVGSMVMLSVIVLNLIVVRRANRSVKFT